MKSYQEIFNKTLTRIRFQVEGNVYNHRPLMKAIVKSMYDFSDELVKNGIIEDRGQGSRYGKNSYTIL